MKRRVLVLAALWAVLTAAALATPGCYGRRCEGSFANFGAKPGEGRMVDENTWESAPLDGDWIFFPGARGVFFEVPAFGDRKPLAIHPYISPFQNFADAGSNFTPGGGNLTELSGVGVNRFNVSNGSCADYWLRVVVDLEPRPPSSIGNTPATADAAVDDAAGLEAGASDAGADGDAEAGP